MKTGILSMIAVVAMMWGAGVARDSTAQTRSEIPMEHASPGHQRNGPPDEAFHHRFEDAEKWAKEFDNRERDAWPKPEEIWMPYACSAVRLSPISARAPGISACELQGAS
jgi:hypothetical protein